MIGSSASNPAIQVSFDQIASPKALKAMRRLKPCWRTVPSKRTVRRRLVANASEAASRVASKTDGEA